MNFNYRQMKAQQNFMNKIREDQYNAEQYEENQEEQIRKMRQEKLDAEKQCRDYTERRRAAK